MGPLLSQDRSVCNMHVLFVSLEFVGPLYQSCLYLSFCCHCEQFFFKMRLEGTVVEKQLCKDSITLLHASVEFIAVHIQRSNADEVFSHTLIKIMTQFCNWDILHRRDAGVVVPNGHRIAHMQRCRSTLGKWRLANSTTRLYQSSSMQKTAVQATTQVSEFAQRQFVQGTIDFAGGQVRLACCLALARLVLRNTCCLQQWCCC